MNTILIVDDIANNIKILKSILELDGYGVKVANSGKRAIELSKKEPIPDLILLDVMMPEMDGYEVCQCIKSDDVTKDIPVIFVSANHEIEDETKGFEVGAVDYISKPISEPIVKARVKTHLELKLARDELNDLAQQESKLRYQQEKLFLQQSKMATMGEMMDAVAHQWKQPLSIISLKVTEFQIKKNLEI